MAKDKDVLIVLGSAADEPYIEKCIKMLREMEISYSVKVASAHRSPDRLVELLKTNPADVIIAFAGHAAHLGGVIASKVSVPVLAVPIPSSDLKGWDSLLATVQMPGGIPVATMALGSAGSQNAACFAAQILALNNSGLKNRLEGYRKAMAEKVARSSLAVEEKMEPLIFDISDPGIWEQLKKKELQNSVFVSPTDTVYGLGTLFSNPKGMERVLHLKERQNSQFIILARNHDEVMQMAKLSSVQEIIVKRYWPGSISFILNSRRFPRATLAARVPMDPFLQKLMHALGGPILSTSCNIHGTSPVTTVSEAIELFGNQVDFYVDGGSRQNAVVSTLVDLTSPRPKILREGAVRFP